eukprot:gene24600-biopygen2927
MRIGCVPDAYPMRIPCIFQGHRELVSANCSWSRGQGWPDPGFKRIPIPVSGRDPCVRRIPIPVSGGTGYAFSLERAMIGALPFGSRPPKLDTSFPHYGYVPHSPVSPVSACHQRERHRAGIAPRTGLVPQASGPARSAGPAKQSSAPPWSRSRNCGTLAQGPLEPSPLRIPAIPGRGFAGAGQSGLAACRACSTTSVAIPLWRVRVLVSPKTCWDRSSTPRTMTDQRRRNGAPGGDPGGPAAPARLQRSQSGRGGRRTRAGARAARRILFGFQTTGRRARGWQSRRSLQCCRRLRGRDLQFLVPEGDARNRR